MTRKTNQNGIELIKHFEGLRLDSYPDPGTGAKPYTIGYGHTGPEVQLGQKITAEQAEATLRADLDKVELAVSSAVPESVTDNQFAALVAFTFNVGVGNLKKSTLLRLLNEGDTLGCTDEFVKWNKAAGKVLAGLTTRRRSEQSLFATADEHEWSVV